MRSFVRSFVCACVRSFVRSCVHAFVRSCVHAFVRSCVHAFVRSSLRPFVRSSVHSFVLSFFRSLVLSFTLSLCFAPGAVCDPVPKSSRRQIRPSWPYVLFHYPLVAELSARHIRCQGESLIPLPNLSTRLDKRINYLCFILGADSRAVLSARDVCKFK